MNRRGFFGRVLGAMTAAVVAKKVKWEDAPYRSGSNNLEYGTSIRNWKAPVDGPMIRAELPPKVYMRMKSGDLLEVGDMVKVDHHRGAAVRAQRGNEKYIIGIVTEVAQPGNEVTIVTSGDYSL